MRSIVFPAPYRLQGWTTSVLLHAIVVSLAILALADVKLVPDQNVFRWEVAVVESPTQKPATTPAAEPRPPALPAAQSMPVKTASPSNTPRPSPTRRVEAKPIVQSQQPPPTPLLAQPFERRVIERRQVEEAQPIKQNEVSQQVAVAHRPVETPQTHEQTAVAQEKREPEKKEIEKAAPIETQISQEVAVKQKSEALQETTPVTEGTAVREVAPVKSPQSVARQVTPVEEIAPSSVEKSVTQTATPLVSRPTLTRDVTPIIKESTTVELTPPVIARADPQPSTKTSAPVVSPAPSAESTQEQTLDEDTHSPQARQDALLSSHPSNPERLVSPAQPRTGQDQFFAPETRPVPSHPPYPARAETRSGPGEAVDPTPQARQDATPPVRHVAKAYPAPRADFGWLTQALLRRIEQLKRYPQKARLNRWEGTVVVRAIIREDGYFADLTMEKSSGHEVLDLDAIELLRKASPMTLKHELGRPQVTIRIPIRYKLE